MKRLPKSLVLALVMCALLVAVAAASLPAFCIVCDQEFVLNDLVNHLPDFVVIHDHCYEEYLYWNYGGYPPSYWGTNYDPSDVPWGG